jgi:SepF-like predicted cell division protein (DUF552 family)
MSKLFEKLFQQQPTRSLNKYVELSSDNDFSGTFSTQKRLHVAKVKTNQDLLQVKDALYAGDTVIVDITDTTGSITEDRIFDQLKMVAQDVNGDIAQRSKTELILTPSGTTIGRECIGSK